MNNVDNLVTVAPVKGWDRQQVNRQFSALVFSKQGNGHAKYLTAGSQNLHNGRFCRVFLVCSSQY